MMVLSGMTASRSGLAVQWSCSRCQMPLSHHRENRWYTVFHLPYRSGSSRHCAPDRAIQWTPSMKRRHCASLPEYTSRAAHRHAYTLTHWSSRNAFVSMTPPSRTHPDIVNRT